LIVDDAVVQSVGFHPISIYRDAIALGYLMYQPEPGEVLEPVTLSRLHPVRDAAVWADRAVELGLPPLEPLQKQLQAGHPVRFSHSGDRIDLAECLIGLLSHELVTGTSFSTSLVPSSDRPFVLTLVMETSKQGPKQRKEGSLQSRTTSWTA
jgi:hypothetical protein